MTQQTIINREKRKREVINHIMEFYKKECDSQNINFIFFYNDYKRMLENKRIRELESILKLKKSIEKYL